MKTAAHVVEHDAGTEFCHKRLGPACDTFGEQCVVANHSIKLKGKVPRIRQNLPMKMAQITICGPITLPTIGVKNICNHH